MKACLNIVSPLTKPKYNLMIDSEKYCEGKLKKNPEIGCEIEHETDYLKAVRAIIIVITYLLYNGSAS